MSPPVCPSCHSPLDPTHAPIARVRGAKIVTYCSTACADAPAGAPAAPARPQRPAASPPPQRAAAAQPPGAVPWPEHRLDELGDDELDAALRRPRSRGKRRLVLALAGLIMLGGMGIAIVQAVSPSTPTRAAASRDQAPETNAPAPAPAPAPAEPAEPAPDPADLVPERLRQVATETLRELLDSGSPRLERLAAIALARTGDEAALERLRKLLGSENSELTRIHIAHALARAGDARGKQHLIAGLEAERRDVRLDAARSLVDLGDDSGERTLESMMSIRTHRVGAAGLLARLGNEEGRALLTRELRDQDPETRMRAAVALGRAGDESVADELTEILADRRYNVGAADALATLGDPSAVPALTRQLALSGMRVRAAEALHQLGAEVDLAPLAVALTSGDDASRVSAAEAVLILTGASEAAPE